MPENNRAGNEFPAHITHSPEHQPQEQTAFTPELLDRILSVQEADAQSKIQEQELRRLETEKTFEFAVKALEAKTQDNKDARLDRSKEAKHRYIFIVSLVIVISGFLAFAVMNNKDQLALEVIKGVGLLAAGYIGGRGHQKVKDLANNEAKNE